MNFDGPPYHEFRHASKSLGPEQSAWAISGYRLGTASRSATRTRRRSMRFVVVRRDWSRRSLARRDFAEARASGAGGPAGDLARHVAGPDASAPGHQAARIIGENSARRAQRRRAGRARPRSHPPPSPAGRAVCSGISPSSRGTDRASRLRRLLRDRRAAAPPRAAGQAGDRRRQRAARRRDDRVATRRARSASARRCRRRARGGCAPTRSSSRRTSRPTARPRGVVMGLVRARRRPRRAARARRGLPRPDRRCVAPRAAMRARSSTEIREATGARRLGRHRAQPARRQGRVATPRSRAGSSS